MITRIASLAGIAIFAANAVAQTPDQSRIDKLVQKLGSTAYVQREQAYKELSAMGTPALDALRKAATTADVETARRLADLIRIFEEQLLTKQVLTPKEVHLKLKDATVQEAMAELASISGYPIQFAGDATKFAGKKITLDTGKVPFWQAVQTLCDVANLAERVDLTALLASPGYATRGKGGAIRRVYPSTAQPVQAGPILLTNRGAEKSLVQITGSLKTELRVSRDASTKDLILTFIVSGEPSMVNNGILGRPAIERAMDAQNRTLAEITESTIVKKGAMEKVDLDVNEDFTQPMQRFTQIRVKAGDAQSIKELAGKLTYQIDVQNEMIAKIEDILQAEGKSAQTPNGGAMRVLAVRKKGNDIHVDVSLENTGPNPFGNNVVINGGAVIIRGNVNINGIFIGANGVRMNGAGSSKDLPDLVDSKGRKFKVTVLPGDRVSFVNGAMSYAMTLLFQPNLGQAEPRDLVLYGNRTHTLALPFRFEDIPLP